MNEMACKGDQHRVGSTTEAQLIARTSCSQLLESSSSETLFLSCLETLHCVLISYFVSHNA